MIGDNLAGATINGGARRRLTSGDRRKPITVSPSQFGATTTTGESDIRPQRLVHLHEQSSAAVTP
jgi:hypothetical protein